jgi:hypothetical protein
VGKWGVDWPDPQRYNFFTLRQARKRCKELNYTAGQLELHFKYVIIDRLTGVQV